MARLKIDYGIDLGTTNSAIFRMENGVSTIQKIEVTDDVMPSCVFFNRKKGIVVGSSAYNSLKRDKRNATKNSSSGASNAFAQFKRTMGTDVTYYSSNMEKNYNSEELSAEVLKALKSYVVDEVFKSVLITVPAKFVQTQKDATVRAAKLAGFDQCILLQEPIAASFAYGMSSAEKNGLWLVFDFGGGTFDAALVKSEEGIMKVFDTEGDNYLGGKNLDEAIVDEILFPYLAENYNFENILKDSVKKKIWKEAMATYAEDARKALSFKPKEDIISDLGELGCDDDGTEIELDLSITQEELVRVLTPVYQRAIDICNKLLDRNNLTGDQLSKLLLVGGPTNSPIIRQMIKEQITDNVDSSVDPMTVVANGASLYASTLDNKVETITESGIYLDVRYESTTVENIEFVTIKLDKDHSLGNIPDQIFVELVRNDGAWASGRFPINETGEVIDVLLNEGKANAFTINVYNAFNDALPATPSEITIIQGAKVTSAPLSYNVGLGVWDEERQMELFVPFQGLEKNVPIPAYGKLSTPLKTTAVLRPGNSNDRMLIPIYEAEYDGKGQRAIYFNKAFTVEITGADMPVVLPEESEVELKLKCEDSGWFLEVDIPRIGFKDKYDVKTETQSVSDEYIEIELDNAQKALDKLRNQKCDTEEAQNALNEVQKEQENGSEKYQVLSHLREALRKVDSCETNSEWDRIERKLRAKFRMLEDDLVKYPDAEVENAKEQIRKKIDSCIRSKDIESGKYLIDEIDALDFKIAEIEYWVESIQRWNACFGTYSWSNVSRARQLIDQGLTIISNTPTSDQLRPIVRQLYDLLPQSDIPAKAAGLLKF